MAREIRGLDEGTQKPLDRPADLDSGSEHVNPIHRMNARSRTKMREPCRARAKLSISKCLAARMLPEDEPWLIISDDS
jgi:hypothetical protein